MLQKQVARIKLGETSATEIGVSLKAKSASHARNAGKASVNFGIKPPSGADNKKVKTSLFLWMALLFDDTKESKPAKSKECMTRQECVLQKTDKKS